MGQQQPYQMFMNGMPGAGSGFNADSSTAFDPSQNLMGNPQLQRAIQASLQNPNGDTAAFEAENKVKTPEDMLAMGEEMGFFPKPLHALYGAIAAVIASGGLEKLYDVDKGLPIQKIVTAIDDLPGVRHTSQWLETNVVGKMGTWVDSIKDPAKKAYWQHATLQMSHIEAEKHVTGEVLKRLEKTVPPSVYAKLNLPKDLSKMSDEAAKQAIDAIEKLMPTHLVNTEKELMKTAFQKLGKDSRLSKEVSEKLLKASSFKEVEKIINNKGFLRRLGIGTTKIDDALKTTLLNTLENTRKEASIYQRLRGAYNRIDGLKSHYISVYKGQKTLRDTLKAGQVGPVGRILADVGNSTRRLLSGSTFGQKLSKTPFLNMFTPALMGAFTMGQAFTMASKAEEGDKLASFSHEFLGFGVGNLLGWEMGRRFLNKFGIVDKAMGFFNKSHWAEKIAIQIPRFLQKIPFIGPKLQAVKWGITLVGFAAEMGAMFVTGHYLQKGGEWVSHAIFGKPKSVQKEELEAQGITQAMGSEPGAPINRISRFDHLENMDFASPPSKASPPMPANIGLDPREAHRSSQTRQVQMPQDTHRPQFELTPEQIMINPEGQKFEAFENSLFKDSLENL